MSFFSSDSFTFINSASTKIQKYIASTTRELFIGNQANTLISFENDDKDHLAADLMSSINPQFVVYSRGTERVANTKATKKDTIVGTTETGNRFNLKEKGRIKITSDGISVHIE